MFLAKVTEFFKSDNTQVYVEQVSMGAVTAIYVSAKSIVGFNSESAIRLVIESIDGLESYVTGSSTYTDYNCWYAPVFGTDIRKNTPYHAVCYLENKRKLRCIIVSLR